MDNLLSPVFQEIRFASLLINFGNELKIELWVYFGEHIDNAREYSSVDTTHWGSLSFLDSLSSLFDS